VGLARPQERGVEGTAGDVETYFGNNVHRMEYPEYEAEGWCIGSGVVESACKTVVGQRLKGVGMRGDADNAEAVMSLEALEQSGARQSYWDSFLPQPA